MKARKNVRDRGAWIASASNANCHHAEQSMLDGEEKRDLFALVNGLVKECNGLA